MSREELLHNAVLFLLDPKVKESSLTSRIQFLQGKGLTESEIQEALKRAGGNGNGSSSSSSGINAWNQPQGHVGGYVQYAQAPPLPPKRDWRDVFIMAVISGGVVYGLTALARKYLVPHLRPPTTTSFQETSQSLTEQYDAAQNLLDELTKSTRTLQEGLEGDRDRINGIVEEVEGAVRSVKDNEERWREEMREVRGEVESVRDLVPKMIEKHSAAQTASLKDLQNELRSLKALLQSRTTSDSTSNAVGSVPGASSQSSGVSATTAAANALLTPKVGRGIPAWQKAPSPASNGGPDRSENSTPEGKGKGKEVDTTGADSS